MLAVLLFFISYYVFVYVNTTRIEDVIKPLKDDIQRTELALEEDRVALKSANDAEVKEIEESIDFNETWLEERQAKIELLETENWNTLLQLEIDDTEPVISVMRSENQTHTYTHPTLFTLETYVETSKWMQDKNVVPLLPWDRYFSYMTLYDREVNSTSAAESKIIMEFMEDNSNKYSSTSIHYLFRLFGLLFSFIGVVFFLFLFGDIVTKEGLGRNGPIHLLRTQPIKRYKILVSKFLTAIIVSFFILVCAGLFSIIVGCLFDRFGDWQYPVLIYGEDRTFSFMGMGVFLVKAISMFMLILLFCFSILFLLSIWTKRVLVAVGLTLATIFMGIKMSEELATSSLAPYIPFQYFSVSEVLTNELALSLGNFNLTYWNGMISLSVASLILFVVTYMVSIVQTKFGN